MAILQTSALAMGSTAAGAAVSLVFGDLRTQVGSGVESVTFDAVVQEVFDVSATITRHPVEQGVSVADHVQQEPDQLKIDGIISNTPIMMAASARMSATYAEDRYNDLVKLKTRGTPITVYTSKREYENMVITKISRTREAVLGDSVNVSMALEAITVAASKVALPPRPPDVEKKKRQADRKVKQAASAAKSQSLLLQIAKFLGL